MRRASPAFVVCRLKHPELWIDIQPLNNLKERLGVEGLVFLRETSPLVEWLVFPAEVANILIKPEEDSLSPPWELPDKLPLLCWW